MNLTGTYFNPNDFGQSNQNAVGVMNAPSNAVLYVFKPYANQFGDVGLRPFQYQFDENFIHTTQDIGDVVKRGTAHAPHLIRDLMATSNLNDQMMPSYTPSMRLRSSFLSDKYRFILIFTEKANNLIMGGNTIGSNHSNSQVRRIYTGYFEDEPFNPTTFSSTRRSLNENSFMVITHKTIVGTSVEHGQLGARTQLRTQSSEEIIHPQITNALIGNSTNSPLFLMTPSNCINSIDVNDEGFSIAVPGAHSDISKDRGANVVADLLEQPAHNVALIVKGMLQYQDELSSRGRLSTHQLENYFDDSFAAEGSARMALGRYMSLPRARKSSIFDLDIDSRISPVDLDQLVNGELNVIDFDSERPTYYETADQMEVSVTNQYSFLISSVVVPILNSAGLNAMQFEYQIARLRGQVEDDFIIHSAEPIFTAPQNDIFQMVNAVKIELINGIFSTIFHSKGDFHVAVSANATGMTTIRLSLVGQGYKNGVDFELPSCMGGLISPLLGDSVSNSSNSESIETLYQVATGTHTPSYFDDEDKNFMKYAESQNWDQSFNGSTLVLDQQENEIHLD